MPLRATAGRLPVLRRATGRLAAGRRGRRRGARLPLHDEGGGLRLLEEWEFLVQSKKIGVTVLEITDSEHRPLSCYFRERCGVDGDHEASQASA